LSSTPLGLLAIEAAIWFCETKRGVFIAYVPKQRRLRTMSKKINRLERKREREAEKMLRKIQKQKPSLDLAKLLSESNNDVSDPEKTV
jgi:hypothetical protein